MMTMRVYGRKMTKDDLDEIATYMNNEIREKLHSLAPCEPEEFLAAYIEQDPEIMEILENEFEFEMISPIKVWRTNAHLTQQQMSEKMGIPKRSIENWEGGKRACPEWAERLIIKELKEFTVAYCENKMRQYARKQKNDEDGNRPEVRWGLLDDDDSVTPCESMEHAICQRERFGSGSVICYIAGPDGDYFLPKDQSWYCADHEEVDII